MEVKYQAQKRQKATTGAATHRAREPIGVGGLVKVLKPRKGMRELELTEGASTSKAREPIGLVAQ